MDLTPNEARVAVDAAIESRYKRERKDALKHVAIAIDDVKTTRNAVKNINAGVDDVVGEDGVNYADVFINAMLSKIDEFPVPDGHENRVNHELLKSIHDFWIDVEAAFKENGKKWHGAEYKTLLRSFEATVNGVLKHNARLAEFMKKKYEKVARAEGIKDKLSALERAEVKTNACQERVAPLKERAKEIEETIKKEQADVQRLEGNDLLGSRDGLLGEVGKVKQVVQSILSKIEKSLRMFGNALDNDRFSLNGISRSEIDAYLANLFASLIKEGVEHPRFNVILDNLLSYLHDQVQMKTDKKEKAVACIEAMRRGNSLDASVKAYIELQGRANDVEREIERQAIAQGLEVAGRRIHAFSSQQAALGADIAKEAKNLDAAHQEVDALQREIEQDIATLSGEAVHVVQG
ncbi:MAG TPA: hypothetical protein VKM55_12220 [Candidatus Lokiarchaeia archaeon]|nr:hypothetical protein [Candidatus Lokiarchaeia archaeon]